MKWVNISVDVLNSVEFVSSDPTERGTWLSLLGWCCQQENAGTIEGCKSWGSRMWQQLCGVTKEEVEAATGLFGFVGENLVVQHYPHDQEAIVRAKRENGKKGGRPRKALSDKEKKPHGLVSVNHMVNLDETKSKPRQNHNSNSNSKGKERKGRSAEEGATKPPEASWCAEHGWKNISDSDLSEWLEAFPACDIPRQLALMSTWLKANPSKAQKKQWRRFIVNWLTRAQERGGDSVVGNGVKTSSQPFSTQINTSGKPSPTAKLVFGVPDFLVRQILTKWEEAEFYDDVKDAMQKELGENMPKTRAEVARILNDRLNNV